MVNGRHAKPFDNTSPLWHKNIFVADYCQSMRRSNSNDENVIRLWLLARLNLKADQSRRRHLSLALHDLPTAAWPLRVRLATIVMAWHCTLNQQAI
jgi:hypothetical protein